MAPVVTDSPGSYDFVVVANRLPVDRVTGPDGTSEWKPSPGGLVTALEPVMQTADGAWVGWSGNAGPADVPFDADGMRLVPVELSHDDVADYYEGFCNATLWPLYHDVIAPPEFHRHWWEAYVSVNRRFAEAAATQAADQATVWVHDYQLQLVPQMLRDLRPDLRIGFFNHIPFPGYEIFAQLPWRRQIVSGLTGADLVGFQRRSDATNFQRACRRAGHFATKGALVRIPHGDGERLVHAAAFPISIDTASLAALAKEPQVRERSREIRASLGDPDVVLLGVDRLDYTKGILHRLRAYEEVLADESLAPLTASLILVAAPSRERVEQYRLLRDEVEVAVGRVNGEHGELGNPAVNYLHQSYPKQEMAALFLAADVMLVTSLRDGMNLVAKEYVACRNDESGTLVLSEFTGAADELNTAIIVNPHDIEELKAAIVGAAQLPPQQARRRMRAMRRQVQQHDVTFWARAFLVALAEASATEPSPTRADPSSDAAASRRRSE
jgi:trehalose 6-phosphate synthase